MALEALFDSVIIKMGVEDTIIEMTDEVAAKAYADSDKEVVGIGPEFEGDLKVGDKVVLWPGSGILHNHKFVIVKKHEILAKVV